MAMVERRKEIIAVALRRRSDGFAGPWRTWFALSLECVSSRLPLVMARACFFDKTTRAYYFAAERRSIQNPTIVVLEDNNPTNSVTLRPGDVDPRIGGLANYFRFQPANLDHERLTIITQSKDIDMDEKLAVETRGPALLPSWKAVVRNSRTGQVIFQCESADFPSKSGLRDCPQNPLAADK